MNKGNCQCRYNIVFSILNEVKMIYDYIRDEVEIPCIRETNMIKILSCML